MDISVRFYFCPDGTTEYPSSLLICLDLWQNLSFHLKEMYHLFCLIRETCWYIFMYSLIFMQTNKIKKPKFLFWSLLKNSSMDLGISLGKFSWESLIIRQRYCRMNRNTPRLHGPHYELYSHLVNPSQIFFTTVWLRCNVVITNASNLMLIGCF